MPADRDTDTSLSLLERLHVAPDDPQAWLSFVERYEPRMRRWCAAWGLQSSDADDVVQDVLVKLFASLRRFRYDPAGNFRSWLRTVTQHARCDFLAARRRDLGAGTTHDGLIAEAPQGRIGPAMSLETVLEQTLLELAVHRIQGRVKQTTWDAFRLTAIEGLSGADAARKLGMAIAHVFVAKHRVRKMLQEEIRILEESGG